MKKITLLALFLATGLSYAQTPTEQAEIDAINLHTTELAGDPAKFIEANATNGSGEVTQLTVQGGTASPEGTTLYNQTAAAGSPDFSEFTQLTVLKLNRYSVPVINISSTSLSQIQAFKSRNIESITFPDDGGNKAMSLTKFDIATGGPIKTIDFDRRTGDAPNLISAKLQYTKLPISEFAKVFDAAGILAGEGNGSSDYSFNGGTDINAFNDDDLIFTTSDVVDLSAEFIIVGAELESQTVLTWYKGDDSPAVEGVDYTEDIVTKGKYTFINQGTYYYKAYNTHLIGSRKGVRYIPANSGNSNYANAQSSSLNEAGREQQSATITVTATASIDEANANELLGINSNGILTKKSGELKVINLSGQTVLSKATLANEFIKIDFTGIFIIQFTSNGKTTAVKAVF